MDGRLDVQRQHPARIELAAAGRIEFARVQRHGGAEGIGQVQHDLVEALLALLHEGAAIAEQQFQPRIVKGTAVDGRQPFTRHLHHIGIKLGQHHALHVGVLEQLLGRSAIAAANDQRRTRASEGHRGQMDHRLVVEELVPFRGHEAAVDAHGAAEQRRVQDLDVLHGRAALRQQRVCAHVEAEIVGERFQCVAALRSRCWGAHARTTRCRCGSAGLKASFSCLNSASALPELSCE